MHDLAANDDTGQDTVARKVLNLRGLLDINNYALGQGLVVDQSGRVVAMGTKAVARAPFGSSRSLLLPLREVFPVRSDLLGPPHA